MTTIGTALIRKSNGEIVSRHASADLVHVEYDGEGRWVAPGWENDDYALVNRVCETETPGGQRVASESESLDGGVVVVSRTYEPVPTPPVIIPKRVIVDRLYAAGKLDAARAALDAADLYTQERWNCRDSIYSDDPTAIALLTAIGADPAVILAP